MEEIKLIASDLDGTVLNSQHLMSEYTQDIWMRCRANGIHMLPVTGRPLSAMMTSLPEGLCEYSINSNGVKIYRHEGHEKICIRDQSMNWEKASEIISAVEDYDKGLFVQLYKGEMLYAVLQNEKTEEYMRRTQLTHTILGSWDELEGSDVAKIMVLDTHENLLPVQDMLVSRGGASVTFSMPHYLEIFNEDASKGKALLFLAERLGIKQHEMLSIGDSFNDIPLFDVCERSYVMKNAIATLAPHLPRTELDNNADGAAKLFVKLCGL